MKIEMYDLMFKTESYHWWFQSKYKIVIDLLEKYGFSKDSENGNNEWKIIDYGCGCGYMLKTLQNKVGGKICGVDISEEALRFCKKNKFKGKLLKADIENWEPEEKFDCAIVLDVIEHIKCDGKAVEHIANGMKKGGICVFAVPALMSLWSEHDKNYFHYRRYEFNQFQKLIEKNFSIKYISYYNSYLYPIIWMIRKIQNIFHIDDSHDQIENMADNGWLNKLLFGIFYSEAKQICKGKVFHKGASLICVAEKSQD